MLVVAFSGAGGGWYGAPTSPPTGRPGCRRSAPRLPCIGRRPWAVRGVMRVWVRDASLMVGARVLCLMCRGRPALTENPYAHTAPRASPNGHLH